MKYRIFITHRYGLYFKTDDEKEYTFLSPCFTSLQKAREWLIPLGNMYLAPLRAGGYIDFEEVLPRPVFVHVIKMCSFRTRLKILQTASWLTEEMISLILNIPGRQYFNAIKRNTKIPHDIKTKFI